MHVGVLGGGLQGCCIALALAERSVRVTLFDKNDRLLSRAAVANEGKIHLGYMYAADPSGATARMMMRGALAFAPFVSRQIAQPLESFAVSQPAVYVVHRDSQRSPEQVAEYLSDVHALIRKAAQGRPRDYFGVDLSGGPRVWSAEERESEFNPAVAMAAFDSPEVAINPVELARVLRDCVAANAKIEIRLAHEVLAVENSGRPSVLTEGPAGPGRDRFDHVINALWDGRFAIDATLGLRPRRPWIHRLKYGVSFQLPAHARRPPSATIVSGPFGEVVSYGGGLTYLTWYPECLQALSGDLRPPDWPTCPEEPLRSKILAGTLRAMSGIIPSLGDIQPGDLIGATVKGGAIVAWGETDIDDPKSELHRRFEIGVTSTGRFHSVDPGKLTMAPHFADVCADRIAPVVRH